MMRRDMAKVIVERPRWGSRLPSRKKGYRKFTRSIPLEDQSRREPLLGRWHGRQRHLSEHLGPLKRYLRSQVGRPWDLVHRDLCEYVSFDNAVQKHILQHVEWEVQRHVRLVDGHPVHNERGRGGRFGERLRAGQLYVCPASGLLKVVVNRPQRKALRQFQRGELVQYLFRDGAWWELRLRPCPAEPCGAWDCWLERRVTQTFEPRRTEIYGEDLIAISRRPLSSAEARDALRRHRI